MSTITVTIRNASYSVRPEVIEKDALIDRFRRTVSTVEIQNAIAARKVLQDHRDYRRWSRKVEWNFLSWPWRRVSYYSLDEMIDMIENHKAHPSESYNHFNCWYWLCFAQDYERIRYQHNDRIQKLKSIIKLLERNKSDQIELEIDSSLWFLVAVTLESDSPQTLSE